MSTSLPTDTPVQNGARSGAQEPAAGLAAEPRRVPAPSGVFEQLTARRTRTRVNRRYSRAIWLLRIILPVTAVCVFAALILWPDVQQMVAGEPERVQEPAVEMAQPTAEQASGRMANPRFSGIDTLARPYTITGSEARPTGSEGIMEIEDPMADITLQDGAWLALRAERAFYDEAAGRIDLEGDVNLYRDDGYTVHSDAISVDIEAQEVWGDNGVVGHGPQGEIVAEGFRVDGAGRVIVFTGQTRVRLRGGTDLEAVN